MINADSAQIYADLSIVAASPSKDELQRAPHRLYGVRDGAKACSAADYATLAKAAIAEAHDAGRLPILVGGTGLYLRTLLEGIAPVPDIDPAIRTEIRGATASENYVALQSDDPEGAARLHPGDTTRVARALEVVRSTGRPLSHWQDRKEGGIAGAVDLRPLLLLPPREALAQRCDTRFVRMIQDGAIEEVETLRARNLDPVLPVMRAIGVPEIGSYLMGERSREEMVAAGQLATRQYMKRQYTWFRNQPPEDWPRFTQSLEASGAIERALALLSRA